MYALVHGTSNAVKGTMHSIKRNVVPAAMAAAAAIILWGLRSRREVDHEDVASTRHDEWLLDEALAETFPASDPISPSMWRDA